MTPLNLVFMGTPDFAAIILQAILTSPHVNVTAVYTQPDRPAGRGYSLKASPVKELALQHGLPVYQPENFKQQSDKDTLAAHNPDVLIVAAYGLILPQTVLDIPRLLPINVHASLLPRLRGAAPIQRSIMQGDSVTGISIMHMQAGLDTGPVLLQKALGIGIQDTAGVLHDELAKLGAELLLQTLQTLAEHGIEGVKSFPQDDSRASYAAKLSKADGHISFTNTAQAVHAHIRGVSPWPGAFAILHREGEQELTIQLEAGSIALPLAEYAALHSLENTEKNIPTGSILGLHEKQLAIACNDHVYCIHTLRPQGKKSMSALAFMNGYLKNSPAACFT